VKPLQVHNRRLSVLSLLIHRHERHEAHTNTLYHHARQVLSLRNDTVSPIGDIPNLWLGRLRVGADENVSL